MLSQKSPQNSPPGIPAVTRRFAETEPSRRNFPLLVYHHIMSHRYSFFVAPGRSSRPDLCFGLNQTNSGFRFLLLARINHQQDARQNDQSKAAEREDRRTDTTGSRKGGTFFILYFNLFQL